jgi:hypothetical protein
LTSHASFGHVPRDPAGRLSQAQFIDQLLEQLAIFGRFDRIDAGADDRHAGFLAIRERGSAAFGRRTGRSLRRVDRVANVQHVFDRQRLEEQHVAGVVIGADRFRIAVDHHAFDTEFAKRETGVAAAIIELDPLADAVRTAAENDDPLLVARRRQFVFDFVGAVVIRRVGFELGRTGIDALVTPV